MSTPQVVATLNGISISAGTGNEVLHNLSQHNSDDGIDTWRSQNGHVAYNISTNNGIGTGNGMGFKIGGAVPSNGNKSDHNLAYNNRAAGFDTNSGMNSLFNFNTSWNNDNAGFVLCADGAAACIGNTVVQNSIVLADRANTSGTGTTTNNSWQPPHPGVMMLDPRLANFCVRLSVAALRTSGPMPGRHRRTPRPPYHRQAYRYIKEGVYSWMTGLDGGGR